MKKKTVFQFMLMLLIPALATTCATSPEAKLDSINQEYLKASFNPADNKESFRVLIMSDRYQVVQTNHQDTILRVDDAGGDRFICDEIKKYDKIDESREGMYHINLFPDRGTLMKVRPHRPMNLIELDNLILDDLRRWTFKFPKKVIQPNAMFIKYRMVLRKKQTDAQIIKEVQKKMLGEE